MSDSTKTPSGAGKWLRIGLWSAQVLLAVVFGMVGMMKLTTPIAQLAKNLPWVADYALLMRFIGLSEVAGAIGLLLPALTRIAPVLTPILAKRAISAFSDGTVGQNCSTKFRMLKNCGEVFSSAGVSGFMKSMAGAALDAGWPRNAESD